MIDGVNRQHPEQCRQRLAAALQGLGARFDDARLDSLTDLVVESMSGPFRRYHNLQHALNVAGKESPREVLIGLFHDLVQLQVDSRLPDRLARCLGSPLCEQLADRQAKRPALVLNPCLAAEPSTRLVAGVFGFAVNQQLPSSHLNEFLSALVAAKSLEGLLPIGEIARLAAGIEATIAFRPPESPPGAALLQRLQHLNILLVLGLNTSDLKDCVRVAMTVANRDVAGFAFDDVNDFLQDTWQLMVETHHELLAPHCTLRDCQTALLKMLAFLRSVDPQAVFRSTAEQDDLTYERTALAGRNLAVAHLYLGSALVSVSLVEALADQASTEAIGLPSTGLARQTLLTDLALIDLEEDFIANCTAADIQGTSAEDPVWQAFRALIERKRTAVASFDSPLAPFVYLLVRHLGHDALGPALARTERYIASAASCQSDAQGLQLRQDFLAGFDSRLQRLIMQNLQYSKDFL